MSAVSATPPPPGLVARASTSPAIRAEFPILARERPRPAARLPRQRRHDAEAARGDRGDDALLRATTNANIHRGVALPAPSRRPRRTRARGQGRARSSARARPEEVVFMRGTTEAINLVARRLRARATSRPGDEILITAIEHHSNIVPWQMLCEAHGRERSCVVPIDDAGELDRRRFEKLLSDRARGSSPSSHVSNALGTINPVEEIVALAHARGVPVLVDGAQAAPHLPVDVRGARLRLLRLLRPQDVRPDRHRRALRHEALLETLPPYQGGGDMIHSVTLREDDLQRAAVQVRGGHAEHRRAPSASAPPSTTLDARRPRPRSPAHEHELLVYATEALCARSPAALVGTARAQGRRALVRARTASTRTTSARSWTTRASRSAPATTARSR